ncbi:hypothetical protein COCVIDRAFT_28283 [Bipolaris victoriae FI3]|uniref:Uncharacterized protein n=1 Tax=Bipolaris victoriae (strain FI3) TaxID=930091 RepID=W7EDX1_BIPV3|nr:hypothetical protein COCVIDRAFT_28283 [Bipolaris victoriae FI3]
MRFSALVTPILVGLALAAPTPRAGDLERFDALTTVSEKRGLQFADDDINKRAPREEDKRGLQFADDDIDRRAPREEDKRGIVREDKRGIVREDKRGVVQEDNGDIIQKK